MTDLAQLIELWRERFPARARGGEAAILGFRFQFIVALRDAVRAFLDARLTEPSVCDLAPERANYWYAMGKALEEAGNSDAAALAAYEKAVQLKPNYTKARLALRRLTAGGAT